MRERQCSRPGCNRASAVTVTYDYADAMMAVGPLSLTPDPHAYDLCSHHDERLSVPQGWRILRYDFGEQAAHPNAG